MHNNGLKDKEASTVLGMSGSWLRKSRMRGDGPPFVRIGRSIRYRLSDLEGWMNDHIMTNTLQVNSGAKRGRKAKV